MAANHKVIGFGKLDGNRAESEVGITLKQKDKKYIIPYLRIIDRIVSLRMETGPRNMYVTNLVNTKNSTEN
jgi:hypothetical protein